MSKQERRQLAFEKAAKYYDSGNLKYATSHLITYFNLFGMFTMEKPNIFAYFMRGYLLMESEYYAHFSEKERLICAKSDFQLCIHDHDSELAETSKKNIAIIDKRLARIEREEKRADFLRQYQQVYGQGVEPCRVNPRIPCEIGSPSRSPGGCDGAFCRPWGEYIRRFSDSC